MAGRLKTNILYMASDSSEGQSETTAAKDTKQLKNISKTLFNVVGSHRLNNNAISQGYFVQQKHDMDYHYQNPEQKKHNATPNHVQLKPRSSKKLMPAQMKYEDLVKEIKEVKEVKEVKGEEVGQKKVEPSKQIKNGNNKQRIKTMMFVMESDSSDNETSIKSSNQNNKSQLEEAAESLAFSVHNKIEQKDEQKRSEGPKALTPSSIEEKIDKKQFLVSQIPKGRILECMITKKNELSNLMFSQFDMTFRDYLVHVASCKKIIANLNSNYRISTDSEEFNYSKNKIIGKVRSCDGKQIYNIYDNGIKPQTLNEYNAQSRQILATVRMKTRKGPRSLEVYVLKPGVQYSSLLGFNLKKEINLQTLYSIEENRKSIIQLKTREPEWVQAKKQYFLNFRGRIRQASIRNFILQDPKTSEQVLLFGKAYNNIYNIDISYPLSPMLGFAIAIPQLDRDD